MIFCVYAFSILNPLHAITSASKTHIARPQLLLYTVVFDRFFLGHHRVLQLEMLVSENRLLSSLLPMPLLMQNKKNLRPGFEAIIAFGCPDPVSTKPHEPVFEPILECYNLALLMQPRFRENTTKSSLRWSHLQYTSTENSK